MKAIFLLILGVLISCSAGGTMLRRFHALSDHPLEFAAFSTALGMGCAAYGILGLGLLGQLSFWPVTLWWLILAAVGFPGLRTIVENTRAALRRAHATPRRTDVLSILGALIIASLCVLLLLAVVLCFRAPGGHEWDALAYHLADPKVFLADHRISSLPTEHHSNFPFTVEMLFTAALLYDGYPLAALAHLGMAVVLVVFLLAFGTRIKTPLAGQSAALLFASAPLTFWQATSAYIDVGSGLFTTLGICAAVSAIYGDASNRRQWTVLAAVMMGFALGTKYLVLLPFGLVVVLLVIRRCPIRDVLVYAALALVIGSPWYIKNIVWTQNPVYPFYFKAFPQSRYWSAERATAYQSEQDGFGYPHSLKNPSEAIRNLVESPWRLLTHGEKYANAGDYTISVTFGGLFAAFSFGLCFVKRRQQIVLDLLAIGVCQLFAWFFLAQIGRYLVSLLPLFALASGYMLAEPMVVNVEENDPAEKRQRSRAVLAGTAVLAVFGQLLLLLWSVFLAPTSGREAAERGILPTSESVPQTLAALSSGDPQKQLEHTLDIYPAIEWINANTASSTGTILFDETRGFYLDRAYLWGNALHSSYIPYDSMKSGRELNDWFHSHHYYYGLINLKFSPQASGDASLPNGPVGYEEDAFQRWYATPKTGMEHWRYLLSDAIRTCGWSYQFGHSGVAVIQFGDVPSRATSRTQGTAIRLARSYRRSKEPRGGRG